MNDDSKNRNNLKLIMVPVGALVVMMALDFVLSIVSTDLIAGTNPLTIGIVF